MDFAIAIGASSVVVIVSLWLLAAVIDRRQLHRELVASLKIGDEVLSSAGIYGRVLKVDPQIVTLEIATGVKVKMLRTHVAAKW